MNDIYLNKQFYFYYAHPTPELIGGTVIRAVLPSTRYLKQNQINAKIAKTIAIGAQEILPYTQFSLF